MRGHAPRIITRLAAMLCAAMAVTLAASANSAPANTPPSESWWRLNSTAAPTHIPLEGEAQIVVSAINAGDTPVNASEEHLTIADELPQGVSLVAIDEAYAARGVPGNGALTESIKSGCSHTSSSVACEFTKTLPPYVALIMRLTVKTDLTMPPSKSLENLVTIHGGDTAPASTSRPLAVDGQPTPFGVEAYELTAENGGGTHEGAAGSLDTRAGSHPFQLTTALDFNQILEDYPYLSPAGLYPSAPALPRDLHVKLPPGLLGDPNAVPQCSDTAFTANEGAGTNVCPANTAIGVASVIVNIPIPVGFQAYAVPVFNLVPAPGEPARFGFEVQNVTVVFKTAVPAGGEYGVEVSANNLTQAGQVLSSQLTLWGDPGDPRHDSARGWECLASGTWETGKEPPGKCSPEDRPSETAFLTLPTSCEKPPVTGISGDSWTTGGTQPESRIVEGEPGTVYSFPSKLTGCENLEFNPSLDLQPEASAASTPTALTATVTMPQHGLTGPEETDTAEPALKTTTVTLPEGLQLNPSAANGLQTCAASRFGFDFPEVPESEQTRNLRFEPSAPNCPDTAKVGSVTAKTPLLANELTGSLYLAAQNTSPFQAPLALYLVAEDQTAGIRLKLAGTVTPLPSGQLVTTFENTPQAALFEKLTLHFFGGEQAPLSTPAKCGAYNAATSFAAWSGEIREPASQPAFQITSGPNGGDCADPLPFNPAYTAGVPNTQGGALTPFTLTIGHADSDQALDTITMHLPSGIAALISNVTPCSEAQALADACGQESLVGHTNATAGLGGEPVMLPGELYLTGALKATATHSAAPFGLLAVTHAAAGPFDLGDVNVLSTLNENPSTAAVTVQSEPIPKLIQGVPADLKELEVTVERPGNAPFQFNPTSCAPLEITGALTGYEGASAPISYPFQATNCQALPFHPRLEASTSGQANKANGASLTVRVTSQGLVVANIAKTKLTLPLALPSRLTTIQKACPDNVFESTPSDPGSSCDEGSQIGRGVAHTPILRSPLEGPAYLVSHGNAAFPDVEFVLKGEGILIVLDGQTDIKGGITTSEFNTVPDAPVESFEAILPEGPHSALAAYVHKGESYDLCGEKLTMPTVITGQNGAVLEQDTPITITGCKGVAASKTSKPTLAQRLAKALAKCRSTYKHNKRKRQACEAKARASYTTKALAACRKANPHDSRKRKSCEQTARIARNPARKRHH